MNEPTARPRWAVVRRTAWRLVAGLWIASVGVAAPAVAGRAVPGDEPLSPRVAAIFERIDRAQQDIHTIRAVIEETRNLRLLAEPERLSGVLLYKRPEKLRWNYTVPSPRSYVMSDGKLSGWIPEHNRLEEMDLSRSQRRIRRLIAIGQDSESLQREFTITAPDDSTIPGTSELVLVPRSRRIRRHVEEIRLWIADDNGLPRKVRYRTGEGDVVELALTDLEINVELQADAFELEVPPGAKIVQGSTSFGLPGVNGTDGEL